MNRGYLYALASAFMLSGTIIINKHLIEFINPRMLSLLFFLSVFFGSSVLVFYNERLKLFKNIVKHWKDGVIVGGFNALAATFFFFALDLLDASTTAFLVRFSTIFIILIGVFFLKEKLHVWDVPGILLAVGGALVINYGSGSYTAFGLLIALIAALGVALHQITAKIFVKRIHALALVNLRTFFSSMFLFLLVLGTSSFEPIEVKLLPLIFVSGSIIAMLGFVAMYKSFELIDVSRAAVIRTADPFIVLLYGLIIFGTLPSTQEIIGGSMIVAGVVMIILRHKIGSLFNKFALRPLFGEMQ